MSVLLSLLLAQPPVLPEIDRRALDLQARAEALQTQRSNTQPRRAAATAPQRRAVQPAATESRRPVQTAAAQSRRPAQPVTVQIRRPVQSLASPTRRPVQQAAAQARRPVQPQMQRPASIRRASGGALDLSAITAICRTAGNQADPATFLTTLTRAYSLNGQESQSLRTSCAAYLAGRADARVNTYGAPAH